MTDYEGGRAKLDAALTRMQVTLEAHFIPRSMSRNASEKNPTLNWRVEVVRGRKGGWATDYAQGMGHVPTGPRPGTLRTSLFNDGIERRIVETGRYPLDWDASPASLSAWRPLPAPALADVLSCLLSDGQAIDATFEDWAADYGYDADSRKAEATYRECAEAGRALARMFTPAELDTLRTLAGEAGL